MSRPAGTGPPAATALPANYVPPTAPRWRGRVAIALLVLGSLVAATANLVVWARRTALDTDTYVDTVMPIIGDENIRTVVAEFVADQVLEAVDVDELAQGLLPDQLDVLGGVASSVVRSTLVDLVEDVLASTEAEAAFAFLNRAGHEVFVDALRDDQAVLRIRGDQIVLDLDVVLDWVADEIDERFGIDPFGDDGVPDGVEFVLAEEPEIGQAKAAIDTLETLAVWLPVAAVLLLAGAVAVAPQRVRTLGRAGVGVAVAVVAVLGLQALLKWSWIEGLTDPIDQLAGESLWDLAAAGLIGQSVVLAAVAAGVGVAGLVVARARPA